MARQKKTPFPPWTTLKSDGIELRYVRLGNSLLLCERVMNLHHAAFRVYVHMLLEAGGKREFEFPYLKYKRFISKDGFRKALCELEDAGLIDVIQKNGNLRKPNRYRFSERWKNGID